MLTVSLVCNGVLKVKERLLLTLQKNMKAVFVPEDHRQDTLFTEEELSISIGSYLAV